MKKMKEEKYMEKMQMETKNITSENIEKIQALFPNCITESRDEEGKLKKAVNFDLLRQMLSEDVVEGDEAYEFSWVGKKASIAEANKPIRKTLRPCPEESLDWETTENLYIEGDNLEVLKLLQESYLGRVKMIYIDPPYNTGNDYIYRDDYHQSREDYDDAIGVFDEDKNRLFKNTDTNGRFHSDWCSMIYPRLMVSKHLLKDEGAIFISVNDSEVGNTRKICDEIFGESNFIAQLIWQNKKGGGNDSKHIAVEHEYILAYARNKALLIEFYEVYSEKYLKRYKERDEKGRFYWDTFKRKAGKQYYPIVCPDGTILERDEDGNPISWLRSESRFYSDLKEGEVRIIKNNKDWSVQFKQRLPKGKTPRSIFTTETVITDAGTTSSGSSDVYEHFKKDVFSNPKPVKLIQFLTGFMLEDNDIVLDFFSGSGTTAEAVMKLNVHGGRNRYILVQLPEEICEDSASKSNSKMIIQNARDVLDEINKPYLITELAKERMRRAGKKIIADNSEIADQLDTGFRVLKLDESNMKEVYYHPEAMSQGTLDDLVSNIKEDRTDLDLLFACLLEWGLPLSLPYTSEVIEGFTVHTYNEGDLVACFDKNIPESVIHTIAKRQPLRAVFRDASFADSPSKINVFEIFKLYMPENADDIENRIRVL